MQKTIALFLGVILAGCSTNYYIASKDNRTGKLMARGFTYAGCVSNLRDRASELDVDIRLERVTSSLIRYRCYGAVVDDSE